MNFITFLSEQEAQGNVGIFWINSKEEIFGDGIPVSQAEPYGNMMTYPESHYNIWNQKIKRQHPEFHHQEYEEVPRGRIVYDKRNFRFIIYLPSAFIRNKQVTKKIRNSFGLKGKVGIAHDAHYDPPSISSSSYEDDWDF